MEITALYIVWFIVLGIAFLLSVIGTCVAWGLFPEDRKPQDPWGILPLAASIRTASKRNWKDAEGKDLETEMDPEEAVMLALRSRILLTGIMLGFAAFLVLCSTIVLLNVRKPNQDTQRTQVNSTNEVSKITPLK